MPCMPLPVVEAIKCVQQVFAVPDELVAGISGFASSTVKNQRLKHGWAIGGQMRADDPRRGKASLSLNADGSWTHQWLDTDLAPDEAQPAMQPRAGETLDGLIARKWIELQDDMIQLIGCGRLSEVERARYEKLEKAMRNYERLRALRNERESAEIGAGSDEAQIAETLTKIDRRIDELARLRVAELAGGELYRDGNGERSAGLDVQRASETDQI